MKCCARCHSLTTPKPTVWVCTERKMEYSEKKRASISSEATKVITPPCTLRLRKSSLSLGWLSIRFTRSTRKEASPGACKIHTYHQPQNRSAHSDRKKLRVRKSLERADNSTLTRVGLRTSLCRKCGNAGGAGGKRVLSVDPECRTAIVWLARVPPEFALTSPADPRHLFSSKSKTPCPTTLSNSRSTQTKRSPCCSAHATVACT